MPTRLLVAMGCYAALATVARMILPDPRFRGVVWIFLGAMAAKTWIAWKKLQHGD
jgi:hypothetical protein